MNGPVIIHDDDGTMRDTWQRPIRSGPEERSPDVHNRDDPQWDRIDWEPCDPCAPDGCKRLGPDHVGLHIPTPESVRGNVG